MVTVTAKNIKNCTLKTCISKTSRLEWTLCAFIFRNLARNGHLDFLCKVFLKGYDFWKTLVSNFAFFSVFLFCLICLFKNFGLNHSFDHFLFRLKTFLVYGVISYCSTGGGGVSLVKTCLGCFLWVHTWTSLIIKSYHTIAHRNEPLSNNKLIFLFNMSFHEKKKYCKLGLEAVSVTLE